MKREARYIEREDKYRQTIKDLQRELRVRYGYEDDAKERNKGTIDVLNLLINQRIENIAPLTEQLKQEQEKDIKRKFQTEMLKLKKKLDEQKTFAGDMNAEHKEKENDIQHNLDLIKDIAQRIDNENRLLIKKNAELR